MGVKNGRRRAYVAAAEEVGTWTSVRESARCALRGVKGAADSSMDQSEVPVQVGLAGEVHVASTRTNAPSGLTSRRWWRTVEVAESRDGSARAAT